MPRDAPLSAAGMVEEAEVVVVGGGPAGSVAAAKLAEHGRDVLVVDQSGFPREKPCGDGLTHSAVDFLQQRGFGERLDRCQPIEDVRVIVGHDREVSGWYRPWPQPPKFARTQRRFDLDSGLFERAQNAGARFLQARVDGPLFEGDLAKGVSLTAADGSVGARCVIAADGATSRMRRNSGIVSPRRGSQVYALRFYADSEKSLDPVFDVYVPLLYEGGLLAGYGWVFPISEHRANIGVAYYEPPPGRPRARIREVLRAFTAGLEEQSAGRFGAFSNPTEPIGAPISTQFSAAGCEAGNVIFAGEAARAADPLSGEGISFAMESGEYAAEEADRLLRGDARQGQGRRIARRYTRLGQDLTLPARLAAAAPTGLQLTDRKHQPFILRVRRVTSFAPDEPTVAGTAVRAALEGAVEECAQALDLANDRALDALRTSFPFALEVLHRELRSDGGPIAAATAIAATRAAGVALNDAAIAAATACELLLLGGPCLLQLSAENSSEIARLNNAVAMLSGRFALAAAQQGARDGSARFASELAVTSRRVLDGLWIEHDARGGAERGSNGLAPTGLIGGEVLALAARTAGLLSGREEGTDVLAEAGRELGVAWQIGTEIRDLTIGDEIAGRPPGGDLLARRPTLPLLYAADSDQELGEQLQAKLDGVAIRKVLGRIRESGALERAAEECVARVRRADELFERAALQEPAPLRALSALCLERLPAATA